MAALVPMLGLGAGATAGLATAATIAGPVLNVMGAIGQMGEARAQGREFERQATEERVVAGVQANQMRRNARQEQSRSRAAMAEGGALAGTGQAVLDQNAMAMEMDALMMQFHGEQRGRSADFAATQARRGANVLNVFSAAVEGFNQMDPLNISPYGGAGSGG